MLKFLKPVICPALFALFLVGAVALPLQRRASAAPLEFRQEQARTHTVQEGETLTAIAAYFGLPLDLLMQANGITDPDALRVGQTLIIPEATVDPASTETPEQGAQTQGTSTDSSPQIVDAKAPPAALSTTLNASYVIQSGDTIGYIALINGVDELALRQLNRLGEEPKLVAGQALLLPARDDELRAALPVEEYIVSEGDTLSGIAAAYGLPMALLMEANRISNPDAVSIGQALTIPPPLADEFTEAEVVGKGTRGYYYYTVQVGDTLSEIAGVFNTPVLALLQYNNLPDEETVYYGLELAIPYGAPRLPQRLPPVPISGSSFLVSLSRQQCWVFNGDNVRHSWNCSTGYGEWITRTGTFAVKTRLEMAQSSAYRLDMPYWLGLYDVGDFENGIHGLPIEWSTGEKLWDSLIGEPATFGCAMLDDADAAALFNLSYIGMPVHVMQ